jgi:hypothetical protein
MQRKYRLGALLGAPTREGWAPRLLWLGVVGVGVAGVGVACAGASDDQVTGPIDLGMVNPPDGGVTPYYSDGNLTLYESQKAVTLPVRKPSGSEIGALGPAPKGTPYPRAPFLTVADESVEVHFTITNADSTDHSVWLLIDPWNEFVRWRPGVTIVDDDTTVPNQGYDQAFSIPANSRIEGTLTSDDMQEIATKLAAVENVMASPDAMTGTVPQYPSGMEQAATTVDTTTLCNNIFEFQNRSNSVPPDPLYTPWIPPVIAGVTGFDLGLRTYDAAANVAIELSIEITDLNGNRFVEQGDKSTPQIGMPPVTLSPPSAKF